MKKILSLLLSGSIVLLSYSGITPTSINATENENYVYGDGHFETIEEFNESVNSNLSNSEIVNSSIPSADLLSVIPSSYDISTNPSTSLYFPNIETQGTIGSCSAFATTYYQFTYEVNKLKGEATTHNNTYSPKWTYNYINGGADNGAYLSDAYNVLSNQGALTLNDFPYLNSYNQYTYEWCSNQQKLINALEYRVSRAYSKGVSSANDTSNLNYVKNMISSGHVGVIWVDAKRWEIKRNSDGEYAVVQGGTNRNASDTASGGHFMAVVGYDNNFEITVNNVTLKGAFKLANSWGETWNEGNDGFIWVMYDALNSNNTHGSQWNNNFSYPRASVFGDNNPFYFVDVAKCDVYFAGLVHFMTNNPNGFIIQTSTGLSNDYDNKRSVSSYSNLENAEGKYIAFDYFKADGLYDLSNYMSQSWTVNFTKYVNHNTYRINPRIVDNYCNPIAPLDTIYGTLSSGQYTKTTNINIAKGRVSAYDNNEITSNDVQLVMRYLSGGVNFSNLQKYLADYNDDGTVSILDVILMNNRLSSLNRECYTLTEYIPELGSSLSEMLQKENEVK